MCAPWNGKVLSLTGQTPGYPTLEEAEGAGLFHPNCRHASSLYIPENEEERLTRDAEQMDVMAEDEKKGRCFYNLQNEMTSLIIKIQK